MGIETAYQRNQSSVDKHIEFIKSIGGMKDVEITTELKEKMAEDLERFWRDTPLEQIAELG
jgi:predicted house-cleaning noncanonical NTP pyrophosphatase (MazG superfamily)